MFDFYDGLKAPRVAALFFSLIAATSAVSIAVVPGILHI